MMHTMDVQKISKEIESFTTIVDFGHEKLQRFLSKILEQEQRFLQISRRELLSKFLHELQVLRSTLQVTRDSLESWEEKATHYSQLLHQCVHISSESSSVFFYEIGRIIKNATLLLHKIKSQLEEIHYQHYKLTQLMCMVQSKRDELIKVQGIFPSLKSMLLQRNAF